MHWRALGRGRDKAYQEVVAEAVALHQGSVEDVGVGGGAEVVVDVIAAGRSGGAGRRWVLCVHWRFVTNSHHKAASERIVRISEEMPGSALF